MQEDRSGCRRLEVYQVAMGLVPEVQGIIATLPDTERFALASQMARACRSVPANIAEGYAKRRSAKEFRAYLTTAMASANEIEVHLTMAGKVAYLDEDTCAELVGKYNVLGRQLNRLIASWRDGPRQTNADKNQQQATSN